MYELIPQRVIERMLPPDKAVSSILMVKQHYVNQIVTKQKQDLACQITEPSVQGGSSRLQIYRCTHQAIPLLPAQRAVQTHRSLQHSW